MRNLLLPISLLFFSAALSGQKLQVGIIAGANLSEAHWYRTESLSDKSKLLSENSLLTGWQAGLTASFALNDQLTLQASPMFVRRGTESYAEFALPPRVQVKLDYLDLPLLLRYHPVEEIFVEAGPYLGYRLAANSYYGGEAIATEETLGEYYCKWDAGAILGLGYQVAPYLAIQLRAAHGLLGLLTDEVYFTNAEGETIPRGEAPLYLNRSIQLSACYSFSL
ncbi:outer membrane beta-barrel protein [Phaeodactylibacter luteus]|uniref:PorT family protein n=1 Tax=Phaeodactylibacter luteus TaxID=1564516 RepID=A0A5C6RPN3_9BACT|nr:outer membrane beta-barrel protein [Phaeodactylibacter luteus]TXB63372.1 PorT family protein [Phaeodactylibacter luteus]